MQTRIFKSGNSLAVRIPKELAFSDANQEVDIERVGNTLIVRPREVKTLAGIGEIFSSFSPGFMAEGRDNAEELERDWQASIPNEGE